MNARPVGVKKLSQMYAAPVPKLWRKIGDSLLLVGSTITTYAILDDDKLFAVISLGCTVLGKVITNFASEE